MNPLCPCGCGRLPAPGRKYASPDGCKQRAYRKRLTAAAEAAGIAPSISLGRLKSADPTRGGIGDRQTPRQPRQKRKPRPGVTVYVPDPHDAIVARIALDELAPTHPGSTELANVAAAIAGAIERRSNRGQ